MSRVHLTIVAVGIQQCLLSVCVCIVFELHVTSQQYKHIERLATILF